MKTVIAAVVLAACGLSSVASAEESRPPSKEESIGIVSGATVGALAGGPVGAFIGIAVGAILGDRYHQKNAKLALLDDRLRESDQTVTALSAQLVSAQEQVASLSEHIRSQPLPPSVQRTLRGEVMFRTKDASLDADTAAHLAELAQLVSSKPGIFVQLDGYADPRGTESENLLLSEQRAQSVRAALLAGGIAEDRIMVMAHGEVGATSSPGDTDGYALDRRVVITIGNAGSQVAQSEDAP
jgi:outer membrane protein OmpA-like peptidoglycan-associated protein